MRSEKKNISHNTRLTSTEEGRWERRRASSRARRRQPLFYFLRRGLGSYHSDLLLSGRRKPWNATHGTATAMQLSKSCVFPLVFWVDRLVLVARGRSIWWKSCATTAMIFLEEPPPGYAVLWSVSVGAALAPVATGWGSRCIASFVIVDSVHTVQQSWVSTIHFFQFFTKSIRSDRIEQ